MGGSYEISSWALPKTLDITKLDSPKLIDEAFQSLNDWFKANLEKKKEEARNCTKDGDDAVQRTNTYGQLALLVPKVQTLAATLETLNKGLLQASQGGIKVVVTKGGKGGTRGGTKGGLAGDVKTGSAGDDGDEDDLGDITPEMLTKVVKFLGLSSGEANATE